MNHLCLVCITRYRLLGSFFLNFMFPTRTRKMFRTQFVTPFVLRPNSVTARSIFFLRKYILCMYILASHLEFVSHDAIFSSSGSAHSK